MSSKSVGQLRRKVRQSMRKVHAYEPTILIPVLHVSFYEKQSSMLELVELRTFTAWQRSETNREAYRLWSNLLRDVYRYEQKAGILPESYQVGV